MANPCLNCGADAGDENPPNPTYCGQCPPWTCDGCGEPCSMADTCACYVSLDGMNLADLKALFADDCDGQGLSLTVAAEGDGRG
jgi:hypothetical protein